MTRFMFGKYLTLASALLVSGCVREVLPQGSTDNEISIEDYRSMHAITLSIDDIPKMNIVYRDSSFAKKEANLVTTGYQFDDSYLTTASQGPLFVPWSGDHLYFECIDRGEAIDNSFEKLSGIKKAHHFVTYRKYSQN